MYRWLHRPYNTPFVGLMMMAPCYLRLLGNLRHYMMQPLRFIQHSGYEGMDAFRQRNGNYPLAHLDDVEVHFLHYPNEATAAAAWERRTARMDWDNLRVKFSLGKDFATPEHLQAFEQLSFRHKLCIGPDPQPGSPHYRQVPGMAFDAVVAFRQSLSRVNIPGWLKKGRVQFDGTWQRLMGRVMQNSLRR